MRTSDLLGPFSSKLEQFFECVHKVGFFKKAKTLHHFVHQYIQKQKHSLTILCIHFALSSCYCFLRVILCQYFLYLVFSGSIRMTIKAKGVRYQIPRERERNIAWELRSSWGLNRVATRQISFIFSFSGSRGKSSISFLKHCVMCTVELGPIAPHCCLQGTSMLGVLNFLFLLDFIRTFWRAVTPSHTYIFQTKHWVHFGT